uniref:Transposase Tc1-like domain-containing protein n=1 Tax=Amphiprion percula TaxID=161767 RepID=A0A3P8SY62_AMPPE
LICSCVRNHPQTSRDLKNETVGKRLVEAGLKSHRAGRSPSSRKGRGKLVTLCWDHKDWTVDDWTKVLFRDESSFQLMSTPLQTRLSAPTVKHGGGSVTIWGSFSLDNAPYHTAKSVKAWMENQNTGIMPWLLNHQISFNIYFFLLKTSFCTSLMINLLIRQH